MAASNAAAVKTYLDCARSVLIEEPLQRHEMRTYAVLDHPKGGHAIEVHAGEVTAQSFILAVEEHGRPP